MEVETPIVIAVGRAEPLAHELSSAHELVSLQATIFFYYFFFLDFFYFSLHFFMNWARRAK